MYVPSGKHKSICSFRISVELPLNIHGPYATYETQFGFVQRPTHKNTSWDIAKVGLHDLLHVDF